MSWFKSPKWGFRLAGLWLIVYGVTAFVQFPAQSQILAILAIAAGVLIVIDR